MEHEIGRRDFLKGAGILGAATVGVSILGGCAPKDRNSESKSSGSAGGTGGIDASSISWTEEADVVVIGSGSAGYCAAIEAAEAGCDVLVLEKNTIVGGDSTLCGGVMMGAGFSVQEQLGGKAGDSGEKFATQMLRWSQGMGNPEVIKEACMRSGAAIDWMIDHCGRVFDAVDIVPPIWKFDTEDDIYPRALWTSAEITDSTHGGANSHYAALQNLVDTLSSIKVMTECEATHLLKNSSGEIIGVEYNDKKKDSYAKAKKAVILACASVDNDTDMAHDLGLDQQFWGMKLREAGADNANCHDMSTNTGDGVRMAREIGADLMIAQACCMQDSHYWGGVSEYATAMGHESNAYKSWKNEGSILVNRYGRRFVQEDAEWGYVVAECSKQVYATGWQSSDPTAIDVYSIIDSDHLWQWDLQGVTSTGTDGSTVVSADTLEALADKLGIPSANLTDEVSKWNSYCDAGADPEFDRRVDFGTIKTGPFYADAMRPGVLGSFAGVKSNVKAEVIGLDGNPIPRLYAAGTIAGGNYVGPFYFGCGWSIMNTVVWGREAGQQAAALDPWA